MRQICGSGLFYSPSRSPGMSAAQPSTTAPTLVTIDSGMVRGATAGEGISFKGIPYAEPPKMVS
jgi:hypothetical protein